MNTSVNPESPAGNVKRLWRVRTDKGETFGPADLATLKTWAQDGRLGPAHQISEDDQHWTGVTTLPELEMDWVTEIMPGTFYGPIHKNALQELVREGSVRTAVPLYQRATSTDRVPSPQEHQMETRLRESQREFARRAAESDRQLAALRGELEQARAALRARDLEFDAERQEHKAALARTQAEMMKREGLITTLEAEAQRIEQLSLERQSLEVRLADAERLSAEHTRLMTQQREELEQARARQRETERHASLLKERLTGQERENDALRGAIRAQQLRLGSVRKLLQQATTSLGETETATDAIVIEAPAAAAATTAFPTVLPPLATPSGSAIKPGLSLADLEAQAHHELRQLNQKGGTLFKGRAKG